MKKKNQENNCWVIALGGNALGNSPTEQKEIVKETARSIVDLVQTGKKIVICHGNGPQVGMINLSFTLANLAQPESVSKLPLPEATAMSQGYIGLHLQNAIFNELKSRHLNHQIVSLVSQVLVDKDDHAFQNPTKPIGKFYSQVEAEKLAKIHHWVVKNDANRGWRRFVASPQPCAILEKTTIKQLLDNNHIVIAGGGGGVPVYKKNDHYEFIPAVIDKDLTAAKIADELQADQFIILTAVDYVSINYQKPNEKDLKLITVKKLKLLLAEKQFGEGSMKPKIEAAIKFLIKNPDKKVVITSLANALKAVREGDGTIIVH